MSARGDTLAQDVARRVAAVDWQRIAADLDERGYARLPGLLRSAECRDLLRLYEEPHRFRKRIDLAHHAFGDAGEYQYFSYPLPPLVAQLRERLYPHLAVIANAWRAALGSDERFPAKLRDFLGECQTAGQSRPTPLLLRYRAGGYNRLHQDIYGEIAFPLQLTVQLTRPENDFQGGEFLLLEQRPRMQSRGEAIALGAGEGVVFPTRERPVAGKHRIARAQMRHGVSRVHSGERAALGIIFHDAR